MAKKHLKKCSVPGIVGEIQVKMKKTVGKNWRADINTLGEILEAFYKSKTYFCHMTLQILLVFFNQVY